jgi:hypothetical protein
MQILQTFCEQIQLLHQYYIGSCPFISTDECSTYEMFREFDQLLKHVGLWQIFLWITVKDNDTSKPVRYYTVIKKFLFTWWLQYRKLQVMFKVSPASLQTFTDTRLTLTPSVIPNSNYVIMVSDWSCLKYFCMFLYCNHQVHRYFWSRCIIYRILICFYMCC